MVQTLDVIVPKKQFRIPSMVRKKIVLRRREVLRRR